MRDELRGIRLLDLGLWIGGRLKRFRVAGVSMLPGLRPGDEILINPYAYHRDRPQVGDLVVACPPQQPELRIVKRVRAVQANGDCWLLGDNPPFSTDSRSFGAVPLDCIGGQVWCRFF